MYIYLEKNEKKPGYIWRITNQLFNMLAKEAEICENGVLTSKEIDKVFSIYNPVRSSKSSYVFINYNGEDLEAGINSFKKLDSLKVVPIKNEAYVMFGEITGEAYPKIEKDERSSLYMMYMSMLVDRGSLYTNEESKCFMANEPRFFSLNLNPVSLLMSPKDENQDSLAYTELMNLRLVMDKDDERIHLIEYNSGLSQKYHPDNLEKEIRDLVLEANCKIPSLMYYDIDVEYPLVPYIDVPKSILILYPEKVRKLCSAIIDYNESCLAYNRNLKLDDYGFRNISLKQLESDTDVIKARRAIDIFKRTKHNPNYISRINKIFE